MTPDNEPDSLTGSEGLFAPPTTGQSDPEDVLRWSVDLARHAPSLYNAQPWSWQVDGGTAELFMDTDRGFPVTDPDNREMRIGCGAALHHLQVAVTAAGWSYEVERRSDSDGTGRLATVRLTNRCDADPMALQWARAIPGRRTDRRPFSSKPVGADTLAALQSSVDSDGVHLQIVTQAEHRVWLAILAERASQLQVAQEGYAAELGTVTGKGEPATNIPAEVVPHVVSPRHSDVPLRDFELLGPGTLRIPEAADEHPIWCILWTDTDSPSRGCWPGRPCPGCCSTPPGTA